MRIEFLNTPRDVSRPSDSAAIAHCSYSSAICISIWRAWPWVTSCANNRAS